MKTTKKQKAIQSSIGVLIAIGLFFAAGLRLPVIDTSTDTYFREAITKAGVAYATCRVINASVSIVKDSTLQLEPAGVGISLAVGQALGSVELDKLKDFSLPEINGVLGTIENSASFLKRKSIEFKNALGYTVSHMGDIIENLLKLTFLYAGIFLIQVIMLPLLLFWVLVKIVNSLFCRNVPAP